MQIPEYGHWALSTLLLARVGQGSIMQERGLGLLDVDILRLFGIGDLCLGTIHATWASILSTKYGEVMHSASLQTTWVFV